MTNIFFAVLQGRLPDMPKYHKTPIEHSLFLPPMEHFLFLILEEHLFIFNT